MISVKIILKSPLWLFLASQDWSIISSSHPRHNLPTCCDHTKVFLQPSKLQVQDGTVGVVLSVYIFNYIGVSVMYHEADVHTALISAIIVTLPVDALARFNQQRDASRHIDYFPLFQNSQFWQEGPSLTLNMWWKNQLKGVCNPPRWMSTSMKTYSFLQFHPPIGSRAIEDFVPAALPESPSSSRHTRS